MHASMWQQLGARLRRRFPGNESAHRGGALAVADGTSQQPELTNCLFYRNDANKGGGAGAGIGGAIWSNDPIHLLNCTFAQNTCETAEGGAGVYIAGQWNVPSTITNCILWNNNAAGDHNDEADGIKLEDTDGAESVEMTKTCLRKLTSSYWVNNGDNNNDPPQFRDVGADNYELDPVNCGGGGNCTSSSIDRGEDDNCGGVCSSGGDVLTRTRKVNLDDLDDDIDMGSQETQELDE